MFDGFGMPKVMGMNHRNMDINLRVRPPIYMPRISFPFQFWFEKENMHMFQVMLYSYWIGTKWDWTPNVVVMIRTYWEKVFWQDWLKKAQYFHILYTELLIGFSQGCVHIVSIWLIPLASWQRNFSCTIRIKPSTLPPYNLDSKISYWAA